MTLIFLTGLIYSSFSLSHLQSRRFLSIVSAVQPLTIGWIPRNFKFSENFKILTLNCHFCDSDWKWLFWLENPKLKISGNSAYPYKLRLYRCPSSNNNETFRIHLSRPFYSWYRPVFLLGKIEGPDRMSRQGFPDVHSWESRNRSAEFRETSKLSFSSLN